MYKLKIGLLFFLFIIFSSTYAASSILKGSCEAIINHQSLHYRLSLSFIEGNRGDFTVTNTSPDFVRKGKFTINSASDSDEYEFHLFPDKNTPCLSVTDNQGDAFIDCNGENYLKVMRIDPLANALRFSTQVSPVFICVIQP